MGTGVKDESIKIRVSKKQKELFKKVAALDGITMTDLLVIDTEKKALEKLKKFKELETIEVRVERLEKQLQVTKSKMEKRRHK